jgi:hypothetical protein
MTNLHTDGAYALIRDGKIVDVFTFDHGPPNDPNEVWLPVNKTEDSQQFVPGIHSRGHATYRIDGNRVIRTFQVISRKGR